MRHSLFLLVMSAISLNADPMYQSVVGQKAPLFKAQAAKEAQEITIDMASYADNYIILCFYPADFSFVCPTELRELQKKLPEFEKRHAVVVAVSTDQIYSHLAWLDAPADKGGVKGITYPLISDASHAIARSYGVLDPKGYALRALFIIDKNKTVQAALINNVEIGRNIDEALRLLDALQASEAHGGVCPASWHKGQKTMAPTKEGLVDYMKTSPNKKGV